MHCSIRPTGLSTQASQLDWIVLKSIYTFVINFCFHLVLMFICFAKYSSVRNLDLFWKQSFLVSCSISRKWPYEILGISFMFVLINSRIISFLNPHKYMTNGQVYDPMPQPFSPTLHLSLSSLSLSLSALLTPHCFPLNIKDDSCLERSSSNKHVWKNVVLISQVAAYNI